LETLAERAGLDVRHVQLIEAGVANPTTGTLLRLAEGLAVPVGDLFAPHSDPTVTPPPTQKRSRKQAAVAPPVEEGPPMVADEACARSVRRLRVARDWPQTELARRSGLSLGAVQAVENWAKSPTLRTVEALATALGVPAWQLLVPGQGVAPGQLGPRVGRR
jgi:transcriptional regulator with XRE-family HTH domain